MGVVMGAIKVEGLREFSRALRQVDKDAPKALRIVQNDAAELVATRAKPRVARKSGKAQRSLKASSTRTLARVKGGGPRQPYYPWLEFGGRVGKKGSIQRKHIKSGRYIYPAYAGARAHVQAKLTVGMTKLVAQQGWDVKRG